MTALTSLNRLVSNKTDKKERHNDSVDMRGVVTMILSGGQGTRLAPLTLTRCKPAVCFGGKYRLIDIPISNAINSGCHKIFILTQFLSASLHQHIFKTYPLHDLSSGFIELLSAEQGPGKLGWYQGTADAVRQNLSYLTEIPGDYFLILSGDQLYRMNYQEMVQTAKATDADLVVASLPVGELDARRMGLLKINEDRQITDFYEKPNTQEALDRMSMAEFNQKQARHAEDLSKNYIGSMGIYLFKRKVLFDLLKNDIREDFGKHLIPTCVEQGKAVAHIFNGYWEDIGTIGSFFCANMDLIKEKPPFNCYSDHFPIFSQPLHLPPPKIKNALVKDSIICEGSIIEADAITNSVIGPRTIIKSGTRITHSYLMGNDFYTAPVQTGAFPTELHVGHNCVFNHVIIDKHVRIGNHVQLVNRERLPFYNSDDVFIRDGIIVVKSGANIPDGFVL